VPCRSTPSHCGGSGPALVCLHGSLDTRPAQELVLPTLERRHDVLAPTAELTLGFTERRGSGG
jgi:hypothetical protein